MIEGNSPSIFYSFKLKFTQSHKNQHDINFFKHKRGDIL